MMSQVTTLKRHRVVHPLLMLWEAVAAAVVVAAALA